MSINRPNELAHIRLDYWTELVSYLSQHNNPIIFNKPNSIHQLRASAKTLGSGNFILVALATIRPEMLIGAGVEISGSMEYYTSLEKDKSRIEREIGYEGGNNQKFEWIPDRGTKVSDIWLYWYVDFFDRSKWPEQHKWLRAKLETFRIVLTPRISALLKNVR